MLAFSWVRRVRQKKRTLNKIAGGIVTFGSAEPPIELYDGPTARKKIAGPAGVIAGPANAESATRPEPPDPGREVDSLGNTSRGDWIRTSDLLNPIRGGEAKKGRFSRVFRGSAFPHFPYSTADRSDFQGSYCPYCPSGAKLERVASA
jgi:hypothetical protein